MNRWTRTLVYISLTATMALLVTACGKLTYDRFQTIQNGYANKADVEATLGFPNLKTPELWQWHRTSRGLEVIVHFDKNGKVVSKSWIEPGVKVIEDLPGPETPSDGDSTTSTTIHTIDR